jgi:putative membrane protein
MTLRRQPNAEQLSRYLAPDDLRHVMERQLAGEPHFTDHGEWLAVRRRKGSFPTFCSTA